MSTIRRGGKLTRGNERAVRFYTRFGYCFDGAEQTLSLGGEATELRMVLQR